MTPCPEILELERYASGDLDMPSRDSIASHLSQCADCASRFSDVQDNLGVIGAVRGAMSGGVRSAATGMPTVIGPYEIVRELGRGGMGIVYEARQKEPKRSVAVKVLHPGYGPGDHHERLFRREVRALGRLRHPGIAVIYEAGRAAAGRSYFVMELIDGVPLTDFAQRKGLSSQDRLALFQRACEAIAYAHQRGVIHRDLKPSNMLVEPSGAVKILDFGLAAVLGQDDSSLAVSAVSEGGRVFGTVPYMSPEHVRGRSGEIDVRSDVYSLGVLLYELLTGRLPYDLEPWNLPKAAATICAEPPRRPSTILAGLRGDLETILLKCLEKEPPQRYQTVSALADDLDHYLADEPILARPPSFSYQLRKLVRRHRLPFALAGTVVTLVLAFGVTAAFLAVRLNRERAAAVAAHAGEAAQRAQADAINTFLQDMLSAVDPSVRPGTPDVALREVLDEAGAKIDDGGLAEHPNVEVALRTTIGNAYRAVGRYDEADQHLRRAVSLGDELYPRGHADLSLALNKLARLRETQGALDEAEALYRRALDMRRALYGDDHKDVAVILNNLAILLHYRGRRGEAETLVREALQMRRRIFGNQHEAVANSLNNLAMILEATGRTRAAITLYRESLAIDRNRRGGHHPFVATTMSNLANALWSLGQYDEAETLLREAVAIGRRLYGDAHPSLAAAVNNLALVLRDTGDGDGAERHLRESLAMHRILHAEANPGRATTMANLADLLRRKREFAEAEPLCRQVWEFKRDTFGPDHRETLVAGLQLSKVRVGLGSLEHTERVLADAIDRARKVLPRGDGLLGALLLCRGKCLTGLRRLEAAESALLEAHASLERAFGVEHEETVEAVRAIVECYEARSNDTKAAAWRQRLAKRPA